MFVNSMILRLLKALSITVMVTLFVGVSHANEDINLQLKWKHAFQFAGYYMAKEKGFYNDVGLHVNIIEGSPDRSPVEHVLQGVGNYAVSDTGVLVARSEGKPIQALAAIFQHSPLALATRKVRHRLL